MPPRPHSHPCTARRPPRADPSARTDPRRHGVRADRRAQRLVDDPDGAVWYAARRIFAYALMIRGGIPTAQVEPYLHQRAWLTDAARLLGRAPDALAAELVESMLRSGSIVIRQGRIHAAAKHAPVPPGSLDVPFPRAWPAPLGPVLGLASRRDRSSRRVIPYGFSCRRRSATA